MSKWQIELDNIGRGKVSRKVQIKALTLLAAEGRALRECKKHLMSKNVYLSHQEGLVYSVCAGVHIVGELSIKSL